MHTLEDCPQYDDYGALARELERHIALAEQHARHHKHHSSPEGNSL